MPKPKAPMTTSIRITAEDRAIYTHLKTQLLAQNDYEVMSLLAQWVMTEPSALAQIRRLSPRWQAAGLVPEGAPLPPKRVELTDAELDDLFANA
jgi:hypothetical protein